MASCRVWFTVGFVLGIVAGMCAGTGTGLSDVLGTGDMAGEVLKTLRALQPTGQQALRTTYRSTEHRSIRQDQLMTYIEQYTGQTPKTVHKPSVNFMVNVFEHLLQGEEMSTILGHTDERMRNKMASLDTLRSYTPTSKYFYTILWVRSSVFVCLVVDFLIRFLVKNRGFSPPHFLNIFSSNSSHFTFNYGNQCSLSCSCYFYSENGEGMGRQLKGGGGRKRQIRRKRKRDIHLIFNTGRSHKE